MSLTDYVIVASIILFLLYAIYDEFIMDHRWGKTRLKIFLQRRNKLDGLIFIGLIIILIYNNVTHLGPQITTNLLMIMAFIATWTLCIRQPKLLFKADGFFYANAWIAYSRIKSINLSEDGVLVIQLEQRRLLIHVRKIDDLEKIYNIIV